MTIKCPPLITIALLCLGLMAGGCSHSPTKTSNLVLARFLIEADASQAAIQVTLPISGVGVRVKPKPVLTEYDVVSVAEAQVDMGRCVLFHLSASAARDLYRLSATNIGRRLVLVMNGQPMGARVLDGPVEGGALFIFLELPDTALAQVVKDVNYTSDKIQQEAVRQ